MLLEIKHIKKRYDTLGPVQVPVLDDVSLDAEAGDSIAIVGPSGSGKSTLLNIIGTLDRPTSGTVLLAGSDIFELPEVKRSVLRNLQIGFIFQLHHLLPQCTVLENVLLPTIPARKMRQSTNGGAEVRARKLLERVGLGERMGHRPGQLSGGECQRAAVVRALINEPKLLLADEPTGSLDGSSAENLGGLLMELNEEEKVTLIVVTHSMDLAKRMRRTYRLRDGRLEE
jgi:ABC-type lipoprotein export system ATPase subunit